MRAFDKAILKLTAIYSGILLVVCLMFSIAIYSTATNTFERRPLSRAPDSQMNMDVGMNRDLNTEIEDMVRERDEEIRRTMLASLIGLNICVFVAGVFLSYLLARATLKPIDDSLKAQEQFVSNASHELRTPLNTMRMENEILRRDKSATKDDYMKQVDSNLEEVDKLSALCTRLLSLSHNEKMEVTEVAVPEVVTEALVKVTPVAHKRKIEIRNKIEDVKLIANREALTEILEILLDNAIKYSPRESKITIKSDGRKIIVSDQGVGIAEDDLPHIFERFYRAEKSHTTSGHGLGLSLAQHLAEQQNLKITAQNNPKKGASFVIQ
ncbi:MAG: sensor histidine kinase [Candidatus Saccharimonadales bacterium]